MNYYLSNFLMGEQEEYIIKNESEKILNQFSYCPVYDSDEEINVENSILLFLKELNQFPFYFHVLSENSIPNVAENIKIKEIQNKHFKTYYFSKLITDNNQFESIFPKLYLDAYNGNSVLITSEKKVDLIRTKDDEYLKYELKVNAYNYNIFYLWINKDEEGWDYITNCPIHPYAQDSIVDEL